MGVQEATGPASVEPGEVHLGGTCTLGELSRQTEETTRSTRRQRWRKGPRTEDTLRTGEETREEAERSDHRAKWLQEGAKEKRGCKGGGSPGGEPGAPREEHAAPCGLKT